MTQKKLTPLIVLLGPTAVGKTAWSLDIARTFHAEIISGDSMQVYRGMDIGTAKLPLAERANIAHHLIDICDPKQAFSVSEFQQLTKKTIHDIAARQKLPFIVGGTGLYIESVCYEYAFSEAGMDEQFRRAKAEYADKHGSAKLHEQLQKVDPQSARQIHPNDRRRVIRALEVYHLTGRTMTDFMASQNKTPAYDLCLIGLTMDRQILYQRIEQRVDQMIEQGLLEEVKRLMANGLDATHISMQAIGYKEMIAYLQGHIAWDDAVDLLKKNTRHFAKRQLSWFRHMKDIHWIDVTDEEKKLHNRKTINAIIAGRSYITTLKGDH